MTRNNWIACAILASATAIGACSPKGGQAGQPDRAVDQQNQASDQSANTQNYNSDRGDNARDNSGRNASDLPVSFTVPTGTKLDLTINDELSSRKNKPGDTFTAKICFYQTPFIVTLRLMLVDDKVALNSETNVGFGPIKQAEMIGTLR